MPQDFSNPYTIKFLKEYYEREKCATSIWFLENRKRLEAAASFKESYKGYHEDEIIKLFIELNMPVLSIDQKANKLNRRKKAFTDGPVLGISQINKRKIDNTTNVSSAIYNKPQAINLAPEPTMKPVEAESIAILKAELPEGGRHQYLNMRKRKNPDEKYYFCETTSGGYGWEWQENALKCKRPEYGRHFTMQREFHRPSGYFPDPLHYKTLEPYSKCS